MSDPLVTVFVAELPVEAEQVVLRLRSYLEKGQKNLLQVRSLSGAFPGYIDLFISLEQTEAQQEALFDRFCLGLYTCSLFEED